MGALPLPSAAIFLTIYYLTLTDRLSVWTFILCLSFNPSYNIKQPYELACKQSEPLVWAFLMLDIC